MENLIRNIPDKKENANLPEEKPFPDLAGSSEDRCVISTVLNNQSYKLVFSDSFQMLKREGSIDFKFKGILNNWLIRMIFTNEENVQWGSSDIQFVGAPRTINQNPIPDYESQIIITYNKWIDDDSPLETVPYHDIVSTDKRIRILIKMRTIATYRTDFRTVEISIWQATTT